MSEAAHSGWTGGTNCNHGGYVSQVAQTDDEACDGAGDRRHGPPARPATPATRAADAADCATDEATDEETEDAAPAEEETCEEVAAPEPETPTRPDGSQQPRRLGGMGRRIQRPPAARTATTAAP